MRRGYWVGVLAEEIREKEKKNWVDVEKRIEEREVWWQRLKEEKKREINMGIRILRG